MDLKSTLILSLLFVAYARAQLVCYHCENCKRDAVVIQPCGFDDPILTPPNFTTLPGGDFNDPNSPILTAPTFPGNGGGGNGDAGNPGNPGDPVLTPPTYPGDNNNNNGGGSGTANPLDPILTPPTLPGDTGNGGGGGGNNGGGGNPWEPILTPPPSWGVRGEQSGQYVCLMAKTIVNNEEVVRRGCARMGRSSSEACDTISGGQYKQCSVCATHLCNTES